MKTLIFIALTLMVAVAMPAESYTPQKLPPLRNIEDFGQYETGKFPKNFRTYPFQRSKAEQVYIVQDDGGNKYLHASDDKDISVQTFKRFVWEIRRWPHFSWRWKAITLPKGAAENSKATNDSACGVYVVFGGYTGKVLKYVWSSTLPVDSIHEKKPNEFYFIVKETGSGNVGQWQTVSVNVMEDYKRAFHTEPEKEPDGFGLLTDGNATHTPAACGYDDFKVSETPF